jgi:hypothetical protein
MEKNTNKEIRKMILEVLDKWQDTELNIKSECARGLLADDISDRISLNVETLIEDVICGHISTINSPVEF